MKLRLLHTLLFGLGVMLLVTVALGASAVFDSVAAAPTTVVYQPLPDYPNTVGVPAKGIYKAPEGLKVANWTGFPDYPGNFTSKPWENPSKCESEAAFSWSLCAFGKNWQVAVRNPNSMIGIMMVPSQLDGYISLTSTLDNGVSTQYYDAPAAMFVISDGSHVLAVRMVRTWVWTWYNYAWVK